ncbi:MAG: peptidylprolyl isomerase [Candidatus Sumerlaeaceae bacterium]
MRWARWFSVALIILAFGLLSEVAFAIPSSSKFQQRAAAFGMGAIGGTATPLRGVLQPTGTGISDHPLFESLYIGEPERVVATTKWGKVTARDLYLFLIMTRGPQPAYILEKYDKERFPEEKEKLAKQIRKAIENYVFVNQIVPRFVRDAEWNDIDEARAQVSALEAYRFVYVANVVRSKIRITDADRVKYLQEHRSELAAPERWRVRYIFMRSEETDPLDTQDAVQKRLEDLRQDILRGKIDFPEAARRFSQAPSAQNGGQVPPFKRGEVFFYLEDAVSHMQPGEVSEVIRGPHGFYLVQLIENLPPEELSLDNPQQAAKVEEGLTRQVLRAQYLWDIKVLLEEKRRPVLDMKPWDEKPSDHVVGSVHGFRITKGQLLNIFPSLVSEDLASREDAVEYTLRRILEGEAIAQEVAEGGAQHSVFLPPMLEMARNLARLEKLKETLSCQLKPSREVVRRFWRAHPELFTPMPMKRIVEVTLTPLNTSARPEQTIAELERALEEGGGESRSPLVPSEPEAVIPELGDLPTTLSAEEGLSTSSAAVGGISSDATAETSATVATDKTTTEALGRVDATTTSAGGAGAESPAKGGIRPADTTKSPAGHVPIPADSGKNSGTWVGPLGFSTPEAIAPSGAAPPTTRQLAGMPKPPVHNRTITPSHLREVVKNYRSADWQLAYRDLGFVYISDHPELPAELEKVPKGSYLPPKVENGRAVTYVVEDEQRARKPSFGEIEAYAYRAWREVELDRRLKALKQRELDNAKLEYKF